MRLAALAALTLASAACGQGDSDNVMAPSANALSPAQVDAALGPEISNAEAIEPETVNAADTSVPSQPVESAEPAPAPARNEADEAPADEPAEETPAEDNSVEE